MFVRCEFVVSHAWSCRNQNQNRVVSRRVPVGRIYSAERFDLQNKVAENSLGEQSQLI